MFKTVYVNVNVPYLKDYVLYISELPAEKYKTMLQKLIIYYVLFSIYVQYIF